MPLPDLRLRVIVPAILGSLVLALSFASAAAAAKSKSIPAELRVVDSSGKTLAQQTQYTGAGISFKSDPKATCFGPDDGGSGQPIDLGGANALSLLADAGANERRVSPLSVSDAFDFGLALCGIGRAIAPATGFWYLKEDHVASEAGGDATEVGKGDEVLWYLIEDFNAPVPDELVLSARPTAKAGADIPVSIVSYADDGTRTPAVGAQVSGAAAPTDAQGKTSVPADEDLVDLTATREGSIPSNEVTVCTIALAKCKPGYAAKIGGTKGDDKITVGRLATTVVSGGGDDKIKATDGSAPGAFKCGAGDDSLTVSSAIERRSSLNGCERIKVVR